GGTRVPGGAAPAAVRLRAPEVLARSGAPPRAVGRCARDVPAAAHRGAAADRPERARRRGPPVRAVRGRGFLMAATKREAKWGGRAPAKAEPAWVGSGAPPARDTASRSPLTAMPRWAVVAAMEGAFGTSFDGVQLRDDPEAAARAA